MREDDTFDSLCERLAAVTGDSAEEYRSKYRLAAVRDSRPTYLPVVSTASPTAFATATVTTTATAVTSDASIGGGGGGGGGGGANGVGTSTVGSNTSTVWEIFSDMYPHFACKNYYRARFLTMAQIQNPGKHRQPSSSF